ncbi:MAG TPA: amidohydrolase family protein [Gemmatimonadaceae bacterium]|nr:amidohydrolase family protein [Gemmatimonadaceae bacterium]
MTRFNVAALVLAARAVSAQTPAPPTAPPIIDMHLHASRIADYRALLGDAPRLPHCVPMTDYPVPASGRAWRDSVRSTSLSCRATLSAASDEELMARSLEIMRRRNVIGVTSGPPSVVARWKSAAPDRVIASMSLTGAPGSPPPDSVRAWLRSGRFAVIGEVTAQYGGLAPDHPALEPYWAVATQLDVPVGIHIGTGPVGAPYLAFDRYRARLHSPLGLEEVLVRHPELRVYIMHAGWPMLDDLLAVLWTHPHVYVDVGAISWALPRAEFHRYLRRIVESGFGKRVLFGSDQMVWPETIEVAIASIESADFLTAEQKRDILYNNAARFLRLSEGEIARHHGR